jgi:Mn-dependent DtxR family transcriptional regulator
MINDNEALIVDFLLNCECATSDAIAKELHMKYSVVTECLIKLKKNKLVENMNHKCSDGRIKKLWKVTEEVRDYLTSD